jgi:ferrous iron transport protein A
MPNATHTLETIASGHRAEITGLLVDNDLFKRFAALGLRVGKSIHVLRRGALGGPLHVRVGTTEIIIRRTDARQICVQPTFAASVAV